jgi:hypothetical protein
MWSYRIDTIHWNKRLLPSSWPTNNLLLYKKCFAIITLNYLMQWKYHTLNCFFYVGRCGILNSMLCFLIPFFEIRVRVGITLWLMFFKSVYSGIEPLLGLMIRYLFTYRTNTAIVDLWHNLWREDVFIFCQYLGLCLISDSWCLTLI